MTLQFLLLEDSELDAELICTMLLECGMDCEVVNVTTESEFTAALAQKPFDLILSDYSLPGFDGISALEIAQQVCPNVPFLFVTATMGEAVAIDSLKRGAIDYVLKQRLDRLVPSINRALRETVERRARQVAEAELYRREQEFRTLVENSPDIIARFDRNLRHLYINPAVIQATGLPPEFFLGKTPAETGMTAAATLAWEPLMQQAFATGQPRRFEFEFPAPDGTQFYQTQFVPEFDRNGAIVSVLSITRDVTESKQAEQAMRQSEAQLRQQTEELKQVNRLKDEFLAVLSHELRSPLNAILGWAQVLRNRQYKDTTLAQALETIERNARLQTQLIEDLLDISRIIRGKLILQSQPTNLAQVIAAAIDTVRLAAEAKSIQIVPLLDPAIDPVSGDAGRLQQVVWNLLSNAIKFTPSGGRVEVKLKSYEVALEHPASSEPTSPTALPTPNPEFPNSFAQITIRDTGIGIPPEFLPHIFDSFRQADGSSTRSYGGLGLGLAIVRHLVELHGGTVTAASAGTNQGTTFTVNLPLMPNGSRSPANLDTLAIARLQFPSLQDVRVLVVDDEADSREFLIFLLEEAGAIVTAVTSAKAALEVLASFKPNVLVSDIGMPREDGYRLIRQVRSLPINQGGNVPAIAVTAYAGAKNRDDAIAAGFQVHLAKPIQPADLVTAIANLR